MKTYDDKKRRVTVRLQVSTLDHHRIRGECQG